MSSYFERKGGIDLRIQKVEGQYDDKRNVDHGNDAVAAEVDDNIKNGYTEKQWQLLITTLMIIQIVTVNPSVLSLIQMWVTVATL